jgi:hypothetical protein
MVDDIVQSCCVGVWELSHEIDEIAGAETVLTALRVKTHDRRCRFVMAVNIFSAMPLRKRNYNIQAAISLRDSLTTMLLISLSRCHFHGPPLRRADLSPKRRGRGLACAFC